MENEHHIHSNAALIIAPGKRFYEDNVFFNFISMFFIYGMFFPIFTADIFLQMYQFIFFGLHEIPKVDRKKYFIFDRAHLSKLNLWQKFNCVYCEYANAVAAWAKDVIAQTETYSCAIKHWHPAYQQPENKNYFSARLFDNNPRNDPPSAKSGDEIAAEIPAIVLEPGKKFRPNNPLVEIVGGIAIYSLIFPLVYADISTQIYQAVYFRIHKIPRIQRSKYIVMDRWKLQKLNLWQRLNCGYCEYANGALAWIKDVIAQTEVYSCAIKHWHKAYKQDHDQNFYSYNSLK